VDASRKNRDPFGGARSKRISTKKRGERGKKRVTKKETSRVEGAEAAPKRYLDGMESSGSVSSQTLKMAVWKKKKTAFAPTKKTSISSRDGGILPPGVLRGKG